MLQNFIQINCIEEVHEKYIVYRDIKPDNFMIAAVGGQIKLVDFGLSTRYIDPSTKKHIKHKKSPMLGTVRYASVIAHTKSIKKMIIMQ